MKESVTALFSVYQDAQKRAKALKAELTEIESEMELAKAALLKTIKPNTAKDGVYHKQFERRSVAYQAVLASVTEQFVPKTKLAAVDAIIEDHTRVTLIDSFDVVKP